MTDAEARTGALPARAMRKIRFSTKTGQTRNPGRNSGSNRIGFGAAAGICSVLTHIRDFLKASKMAYFSSFLISTENPIHACT
jgi:hypothetical protein